MYTVGAARSWAIQELRQAEVKSAEISADLLLGLVLGWDRVRVLCHFEHCLDRQAWDRFQNLVRRHAAGEPLQYLTGEQEFYGLRFHVTPEVLIPRPETELLVEEALNLIGKPGLGEIRLLDVGTGSGCLAVSVAHQIPALRAWATDISMPALQVARENARRHGVAHRIQFVQADLLECFPPRPIFDFILSNPPYVAQEDYDSLPVMVKDYEPRCALNGGRAGLRVYRRLIAESFSRLRPGGYLLLEFGKGQEEPVRQLAQQHGFSIRSVRKDLQGISRCLVASKDSTDSNG